MFDWLYSLFCGEKDIYEPITIRCVRIPADGSSPHIVALQTTKANGGPDCFLRHIPDLERAWGERGWRLRDLCTAYVEESYYPSIGGWYFGFKSFAMDDLPPNRHFNSGVWGDAFIARTEGNENLEAYENGLVKYTDVPEAFLSSFPFKAVCKKLQEI